MSLQKRNLSLPLRRRREAGGNKVSHNGNEEEGQGPHSNPTVFCSLQVSAKVAGKGQHDLASYCGQKSRAPVSKRIQNTSSFIIAIANFHTFSLCKMHFSSGRHPPFHIRASPKQEGELEILEFQTPPPPLHFGWHCGNFHPF